MDESKTKQLSQEEIIKILYKLKFFNNFTHDEKMRLAGVESFIKYYNYRNFIIAQGDWDNSLFVLLKGKVYITKNGSPHVKIAILQPGAVFGEISFLANSQRTTNVIANEPVIALQMNSDLLKEVGPSLEAKIRDQLMRVLTNRLDHLNNMLIKNIRRIPEEDRIIS